MDNKNNESKYKLVVSHVLQGINDGIYKKGDWLPSINEYRKMFNLSRDTVFSGINELKSRGIIDSTPGVGYFVLNTRFKIKHNIFLLFNEFNEFKKELYNSFVDNLDKTASVDIRFHNFNQKAFESLLREANGKYTTYILMPGKFQKLQPLLKSISGRVFLLDHFDQELRGLYSSVAQNFENDTYNALKSEVGTISKYNRILMVQSEAKEPYERFLGLQRFATEFRFQCRYLNGYKNKRIVQGDLFLLANDADLVDVLKQAEKQRFKPGQDFGIISYNDTALKEILAGGISTLSTDFHLMGKTMAGLINKKQVEVVDNPWILSMRGSL